MRLHTYCACVFWWDGQSAFCGIVHVSMLQWVAASVSVLGVVSVRNVSCEYITQSWRQLTRRSTLPAVRAPPAGSDLACSCPSHRLLRHSVMTDGYLLFFMGFYAGLCGHVTCITEKKKYFLFRVLARIAYTRIGGVWGGSTPRSGRRGRDGWWSWQMCMSGYLGGGEVKG